MNNERYKGLLHKVNGLANGDKTTNVYHLFLQKLFKAGFVPFVDAEDSLTDKERGYIPYGAVAFTTHDNSNVYATYVSLHMNTVTHVPDKVFIIEYAVYTYSERSRVLSHTSVDPLLLQKTADQLINSRTMHPIGFEAKLPGAKFMSFTRPCGALFMDANENIIEKTFMDCNLIHPIIKIEKPIEDNKHEY